jgi:hypothetical protein
MFERLAILSSIQVSTSSPPRRPDGSEPYPLCELAGGLKPRDVREQ